MVVVWIGMWPGGKPEQARTLSLGTIANIQGTGRPGEIRDYKVKLFKGVEFGGPSPADTQRILYGNTSDCWKVGEITGHVPGTRGEWDLLGGSLKHLLGSRLDPYRLRPKVD